jgi:hypothetical protein
MVILYVCTLPQPSQNALKNCPDEPLEARDQLTGWRCQHRLQVQLGSNCNQSTPNVTVWRQLKNHTGLQQIQTRLFSWIQANMKDVLQSPQNYPSQLQSAVGTGVIWSDAVSWHESIKYFLQYYKQLHAIVWHDSAKSWLQCYKQSNPIIWHDSTKQSKRQTSYLPVVQPAYNEINWHMDDINAYWPYIHTYSFEIQNTHFARIRHRKPITTIKREV